MRLTSFAGLKGSIGLRRQQEGTGWARFHARNAGTTRSSRHRSLKADEFTRYLAEIRRYPLLSREEETEYAKAYAEDGDQQAARNLVTGNLRLVGALEYRRAWVNIMDLVQEGNIGLAEAVKRFDPYRGVAGSFARYWIRALILQFILKNFRLVSFGNTRAGRKLFFRLEKERARLMQEFGEATPKVLAESLRPESEVVAATVLKQRPLSLTAPRASSDDGGRTLGETLPDSRVDVEAEVLHSELMQTVDEKMQAFAAGLSDDRERSIWMERLVAEDPVALAVLGERFGVSRERIRQVESRLKKRLKEFLTKELGSSIEFDFTGEDGENLMSMEQKLTDTLKTAMRNRDKQMLGLVRMLKSKMTETTTKSGFNREVDDELWLEVIEAYARSQQKALTQYEEIGDAGQEHIDQLKWELEALKPGYRPRPMKRRSKAGSRKQSMAWAAQGCELRTGHGRCDEES